MQTSSPSGLRERKREETRERLEKAAVEIALKDGLDRVTIDAISAAANVSPRTFFNYFESKEDAILGLRETEVATRAIEEHAAQYTGAEIVEAVIALLFSVLGPSLSDSGLQRSRVKLVRKHPQLLTRHVAQISRMSEQLSAAVVDLLAAHPGFAHQSPADRAASAEMVLSICGGASRIAMKEWMTTSGHTTREELERRAIALVADLRERLS